MTLGHSVLVYLACMISLVAGYLLRFDRPPHAGGES